MANTPPTQQDASAAPATSPSLPGGPVALVREDYSAVATAVALKHSASVVLVHHHHVASEQLLSQHGTGFIVWSSAKDYLVLTANHVITLKQKKDERDQVEIVVKMPGSGDYLPATLLRSDAAHDIALLRVTTNNETENDGKKTAARQPLTFDDRLPPPVGMVVVLLGYFALPMCLDGDDDGEEDLVFPDVPGSSPGKIISEASVGPDDTSMDIDNGLDETIRADSASIEGCAGSPLIADHKVVGLLTNIDVYSTVPTLTLASPRRDGRAHCQ